MSPKRPLPAAPLLPDLDPAACADAAVRRTLQAVLDVDPHHVLMAESILFLNLDTVIRPLRILVLFLVAAGLTLGVTELTSGVLAYALAGVVIVVVVLLGTPFALVQTRPRKQAAPEPEPAGFVRRAGF